MQRQSGALLKDQSRCGTRCTNTQDFYPKFRGEVRLQCTDTQDLYTKVKGEVGQQCRYTDDLDLKFRGEVGSDVQTLKTSI